MITISRDELVTIQEVTGYTIWFDWSGDGVAVTAVYLFGWHEYRVSGFTRETIEGALVPMLSLKACT